MRSTWLAVIDIDEFLVPVTDNGLPSLLSRYEGDPGIGGIVLPWVFFGTSHVDKIPDDKLMIEMLTLNAGPAAGGNRTQIWHTGAYKSIVRPKRVARLTSPHYCLYKEGRKHVMLNFDEAQINHYWTRDETFLHQIKLPRRVKWGQSPEEVLNSASRMNQETQYGLPIQKFVINLRKIMGYNAN